MGSRTAARERRAEPPPTVKHVSDALREQGRTQIWLARKLGLSRQALNNYLVGVRPFPDDRLRASYYILGLGAPHPPAPVAPATTAASTRRRQLTKARDSPAHGAA